MKHTPKFDIHTAAFVKSAPSVAICPPPDLPEFAFIGRSNVGKSSLINYLTGKPKLALTSSQPGKTRLINHFIINDAWYLVDLPGYGYAKTSRDLRENWQKNTEDYLIKRENLINTFLLIDSNIPPQKIDLEFASWLGKNAIPFSIVFTKSDKPRKTELANNLRAFQNSMLNEWEELPPVYVSSAGKKNGREELLAFIEICLLNFQQPG